MGVDGRVLRVPAILDLATHGVRVVIPDQRGHGQSDRGADSEYSHATWAADAHALAQHLGLARHALLGHSYGGYLALGYAIRWPESLTHLVLVATSPGPVRVPAVTFGTDADLRKHVRSVWSGFFAGPEKHWSLFDELQFAAGPYNAAFARELPAYDLRERVRGLTIPTLLVVGSADHYLPDMEFLAGCLARAELWVIDGVGHFPFLEAAEEFTTRVSAFLGVSR